MSATRRGAVSAVIGLVLACFALTGCTEQSAGAPAEPADIGRDQQAVVRSFGAGSLVIPLDTTYQDTGTLKAFGLVYKLLRANVPVYWAIKSGKAQGDADFSASGKDLKTGAVVSNHGYRAGAYVIAAVDRAAALPIITAWQLTNDTSVHDMAAFSADVQKTLTAAPRIAVFVDGNEDIAFTYLNAAGIQDSQGKPWPAGKLGNYAAYPDVLTPEAIRGASLTGAADGALMRADGTPAYCQVTSMHYAEPADEEVVREVRMWLDSGPLTHAFMECHAVTTFENALNGHFLSTAGLIKDGTPPKDLTNRHPDSTFAQYDGDFKALGGSVPSIGVPPGSALRSTDTTLINLTTAPLTSRIVWMTGFLDGNTKKGKVSYLGGHEYDTALPISKNAATNGVRLFLESLFESNCADATAGEPNLTFTKLAPAAVSDSSLTYTLAYANAGPGVADAAVIKDVVPTGGVFVSATGGGTLVGNVVTWQLGNLAPGESGSVSFTITLPINATYTNQAELDYKVSLTAKTLKSNTVSTVKTSVPIADLSPTAASSPEPVGSGETITYTVDVANGGPQAAPNGKVVLTLPAGATFESGSGTGWTCSAAAGAVTCTTASIPLTGAPTLTIKVKAPTGPADWTSTVSVSSDAADPDAANNVVDVSGTVLAAGGASDAGAGGDGGTTPLDSDDDGLPDTTERAIGTDPLDADSDDDGVPDGQEPAYDKDSDGDGLINALDPDSDNDGLFDGTELGLACDNAATDARRHRCIADADPSTKTDPLDADTDHGGAKDGSEDFNLNGRVDDGETDPTKGHGADDSGVKDSDGDGLSDGLEVFLGSNPKDADSDDDGAPDGAEPNPSDDSDRDGLINLLDVDSDNDALFDGTELGLDCANPATDVTRGRCRADADKGATTTSPLLSDTDHGGASDGSEDSNLNGKVDTGEQDPTAGHGDDDDDVVDSDGDHLSDGLEQTIGSDPHDADSDDDGLPDGSEANPGVDEDGDGKADIDDPDSDGDGLFDGTEAGHDCAEAATDASKQLCVADADPMTTTGVLNPDTDHGGVPDGEEDENHNGKVDGGERDPNDASDDSGGTGSGDAASGGDGDAGASSAKLKGTVAGGALCSARPFGARNRDVFGLLFGLFVLALWVRRRSERRRTALFSLLTLVFLGSVQSAQAQVAIDRFSPAPLATDGFALARPDVLTAHTWNAQLTLDYANDPLVYETKAGSSKNSQRIVGDELVAHVGVAYGLLGRLTVFGSLPVVTLMQGQSKLSPGLHKADGAGLGDLALGGRFLVLGSASSKLALSAELIARLPTARLVNSDQKYSGESVGSYEPAGIIEGRFGRIDVRGRLGFRFRQPRDVGNLDVGQDLVYGAGARVRIVRDLYAHAELYGTSDFGAFFKREQSPFELLAGAKYYLQRFMVGAAAGPGLVPGYGSPDVRAVATFAYAPRPRPDQPAPAPGDADGDGLLDPNDECPNDPEDFDQFRDEDGCPDPDNDADGVLDVSDRCPLEPEDADGFEDQDGCPEPDNDKDGILDVNDQCPTEAEDKDGFFDEDGCPEPDNDKDTVLDPNDACPLAPGAPEDRGCPRKIELTQSEIIIKEHVEFATNKDVILERSEPVLIEVYRTIDANPQIKRMRIEGHTDDVGQDQRNLDLSKRRARSVARWLMQKGIAKERLEAYGCGELHPIADNKSNEGRQQNRRVEFHIMDPLAPGKQPHQSERCISIDVAF